MASLRTRARSTQNTLILNKTNKKQRFIISQASPEKMLSMSMQITKEEKQESGNFIDANKKNLHNFFKDRITRQQTLLSEKPMIISPAKIFKLRKQQSQKQQNTKITLHHTFQTNSMLKSFSTKKMNQTFHMNSKNQQLISKEHKYQSKLLKQESSLSAYQTPTSSSIVKRSHTAKKRAYISVFGECSMNLKNRIGRQNQQQKSKLKLRPKTHEINRMGINQQDRLKPIISRLQAFANEVNPFRYDFQDKQKEELQNINKKELMGDQRQENELLSWVKSMADSYKRKNLNIERIRTIEDIEKMDPAYYKKMKAHKQSRLWVRNRVLSGINMVSTCTNNHKIEESFAMEIPGLPEIDGTITITDRMVTTNDKRVENSQNFAPHKFFLSKKMTTKQKLAKFINYLISTVNLAKLYGIKSEQVYSSLWEKRKPFQLEGSYAFFKFIKAGDLKTITNFINRNRQFAYQIDNEKRSTLIYAVQNNLNEVIRYFVKIGLNVELKDCYGKNALYYAIKQGNYQAVISILQGGANPWSDKNINFSQIIKNCDQKIKISVKNARKLHIGRNLIYKPKLKNEFWEINKLKIQGDQLIAF